MKKMVFVIGLCIYILGQNVFANSALELSNITASQRTDGSGVIDISYTADKDRCDMTVQVSGHGGSSWGIACTAVIYVDASASGSNGTLWVEVYERLQDAMDERASGDTIWMAAGTYNPKKEIRGERTFQLKKGVEPVRRFCWVRNVA